MKTMVEENGCVGAPTEERFSWDELAGLVNEAARRPGEDAAGGFPWFLKNHMDEVESLADECGGLARRAFEIDGELAAADGTRAYERLYESEPDALYFIHGLLAKAVLDEANVPEGVTIVVEPFKTPPLGDMSAGVVRVESDAMSYEEAFRLKPIGRRYDGKPSWRLVTPLAWALEPIYFAGSRLEALVQLVSLAAHLAWGLGHVGKDDLPLDFFILDGAEWTDAYAMLVDGGFPVLIRESEDGVGLTSGDVSDMVPAEDASKYRLGSVLLRERARKLAAEARYERGARGLGASRRWREIAAEWRPLDLVFPRMYRESGHEVRVCGDYLAFLITFVMDETSQQAVRVWCAQVHEVFVDGEMSLERQAHHGHDMAFAGDDLDECRRRARAYIEAKCRELQP